MSFKDFSSVSEDQNDPMQFNLPVLNNSPSEDKGTKIKNVADENSIDSGIDARKKNFYLLPTEIILLIFSYLSDKDLLKSIPFVCSNWHKISKDPFLWSRLQLKKNTPIENVLDHAFSKPLISVVKLRQLGCINDTLEEVVNYCHQIFCIDIGFTYLDSQILSDASKNMTNVLHLNLEGCQCLEDLAVVTMCINMDKIEVLNLSHCVNLTDESLTAIAGSLKKLRKLNCDGIQAITNESVLLLISSRAETLEAIWLDGCNLTDESVARFDHCIHLKILWVSFCERITDVIVLTLRHLPCLQVLTLRKGHMFSSVALLELFHPEVSELTQLTHVDLNECAGVNDSVISALIFLTKNTIVSLSVNWCWSITDDELYVILNELPYLKRLSLVGNHFIYGNAFAEIPQFSSNLAFLNLTQCNRIKDDVIKSVLEIMPNLIVLNYYGERFGDKMDDAAALFDVWKSFDKFKMCDH